MKRPSIRTAPAGIRLQMFATTNGLRMCDTADKPGEQLPKPGEPAPAEASPPKVPPVEAEEAEGAAPKPAAVPPSDPDAPPADPAPEPAKVDAAAIYTRLNGRSAPIPTPAAKPATSARAMADSQAIYARANAGPHRAGSGRQ